MSQLPTPAEWRTALAPYREPSVRGSVTQLFNTYIPYLITVGAAIALYPVSVVGSVALACLAGLFTIRLFIIAHDCGHGSMFKQQWANDVVGFWSSVCAFTPYWQWRHAHMLHHAHSGDSEWEGIGYFWSKSMRQHYGSSLWERAFYRFYRHPITLLVIGGAWLFILEYRFPQRTSDRRMWRDVIATDAIWGLVCGTLWYFMGVGAVLAIVLPIALVASTGGLWLFYVQHHYEESYWGTGKEWDYTRAALEGSSFLKLPRVLQYFSGNIGFHHVHHLAPKVPNYRLEEAHEAVPFLKAVQPITLKQAWGGVGLALVDEQSGQWVTFAEGAKRARVQGLLPGGPIVPAIAVVVPEEPALDSTL